MDKKQKHVLVFPFPSGQGHINPMLQFARRLVSKGLKATVVTSIYASKSMQLPSSIGSIKLGVISDGYDESPLLSLDSTDHQLYLDALKSYGSKTLAELIKKHENTPCPFDCVVYESFMPWVLDVAKSFGLVAASFFTMPCSVNYIFCNIYHELLSFPITSTPVSIPGLPLMELQDMPAPIGVPGSYLSNFKMYLEQFSNLDKVDFVLFNSFYKLEKEVVDMMSNKCPALLTIGPTIPSIYLNAQHGNDDKYGVDLFVNSEESKTISWLNTKPARSVVYVAFGSVVRLSENQMDELAWGLKRSNSNFLWVVRDSEKEKIPEKLIQDSGENGMVVSWSTQVKILAHEAVGCFLTHSGWNSTMEALSLGVPMVAMPQWSDEPTIAKFVEDVWKVGIRVRVDESGIVKREEIESCIKEVMEGKRSNEMKGNAMKWRELAIEAVAEGGTSEMNITELARKLMT